MYFGISSANLIIAKVKNQREEIRNKCMGEAYFLRGYNYYRLFAQYGGVVLQTEPVAGVVRNFNRASEEETMAQIISDFENAQAVANRQLAWHGAWTKYAAAHSRQRHSYSVLLNETVHGTLPVDADLTKCISLADEVIAAVLWPTTTGISMHAGQVWTTPTGITRDSDVGPAQCDSSTRSFWQPHPPISPLSSTLSVVDGLVAVLTSEDRFPTLSSTEYNFSTYDNVNDAVFGNRSALFTGEQHQGQQPEPVVRRTCG